MSKLLSTLLLSMISVSAFAQVPAMIDNKAFMFNKDRGSYKVAGPTGQPIGQWNNGQGIDVHGVQYSVRGNQVVTSKGDVFIILNDNLVADKNGKQYIITKPF